MGCHDKQVCLSSIVMRDMACGNQTYVLSPNKSGVQAKGFLFSWEMNVLIKRVLLMLVLVALPSSWLQAEEYLNYIELQSFVTNFGEVQTGPLRFMKADVTLHLAPGGSRIDVEKHKAHIRNDLIFLFKEQKEADLATVEAQTVLAQRALRVVQQILVDETGHPQVDDLFFTSLVIQ